MTIDLRGHILKGASDSNASVFTLTSGNTHEDLNKIFFADNLQQGVAYNLLNGEIEYVTSDLNTLTYEKNDGSLESDAISVVDKISVSYPSFTKDGYDFVSWNTQTNGMGTTYNPEDILTLSDDQRLFAIWKEKNYTIDLMTNGGTLQPNAVNLYTYGTSTSLPVPTWTGKTFDGWYENLDFSGEALSEIALGTTGDKTLYAKFSINTYEVTFKGHDGTVLKQETVDHGSDATAPTSPTRVGYTFIGWDISFEDVTSNLEVIAVYDINTYTVTFKDHDGTVLKSETVNHGSNATSPTNPTRVGYTFTGWDIAFDNVTSNLEVTAVYEINSYTNGISTYDIDELLSSINQNQIKNKAIEVIVSVTEKQSNQVIKNELNLINAFKNKNQNALFVEISILIKEQDKADIQITELTKKITLTIDIPLNQQGNQNYKVIRIHDGVVEELESTYNKDNQTMTFETDLFSTYAILYETPQKGFNWLWIIIPVLIGMVLVGSYLKREDNKNRFKRTKA